MNKKKNNLIVQIKKALLKILCLLPTSCSHTHNRHMWADDVLNRELHLKGTLSKSVLRFLPLWNVKFILSDN